MKSEGEEVRRIYAVDEGNDEAEVGAAEVEAAGLESADAAALMDHRAKLLARRATTDETTEPRIEVLTFHVGEQVFAIESRFVVQVYRADSITEICGVENFLVGVTNLKGSVLTLIDLKPVFELPAGKNAVSRGTDDSDSYVAVVGKHEAEFGIVIDRPGQVYELKLSELLSLPAGMSSMAAAFGSAITEAGILLLDSEGLLSDQRLIIDQRD